MKNPREYPSLSAKDICEIMEKAKELGITVMKFQDVELEFGAAPVLKAVFAPVPKPEAKGQAPRCTKCQAEKIASKYSNGFYCHECYIRRKDEKANWQGENPPICNRCKTPKVADPEAGGYFSCLKC